jgi:outer membrane protein
MASSGFSVAETLRDTLRSAYQNSGLLAQNRALLRAVDEDVAGATAALKPILSWSSQYALTGASVIDPHSVSASVRADWLLYDSGRSQLTVDALKETVLATRQSLVAIEQNILMRAVSAHMNYRRAMEFSALRYANVDLIAQELREAEDRFEVGEITRTEVALAEARLASARSGLAAAEGDLHRSVAEFWASVGRNPGNIEAPKSVPVLPKSVDLAVDVARAQHPDLKQMQHVIAVAEINLKKAQMSNHLKVSASAGLAISDGGSGLSESFTLTFGAPIYSGGAIASATRGLTARRDAARAQLHVTQHGIDQTVRNAFVLLEVARASGAATDRQIKAANVAFLGVREEASLGARTTLNVLNAEQELLDARASKISATIDEQIAAYTLIASMGQLTATSLKLGVKTYDPTQYFNMVKNGPTAKSPEGQALTRILKELSGN